MFKNRIFPELIYINQLKSINYIHKPLLQREYKTKHHPIVYENQIEN